MPQISFLRRNFIDKHNHKIIFQKYLHFLSAHLSALLTSQDVEMLDEAEDEVVRLCEYDNVRVGRFYVLDSFLLCMLVGKCSEQSLCATVIFCLQVYAM